MKRLLKISMACRRRAARAAPGPRGLRPPSSSTLEPPARGGAAQARLEHERTWGRSTMERRSRDRSGEGAQRSPPQFAPGAEPGVLRRRPAAGAAAAGSRKCASVDRGAARLRAQRLDAHAQGVSLGTRSAAGARHGNWPRQLQWRARQRQRDVAVPWRAASSSMSCWSTSRPAPEAFGASSARAAQCLSSGACSAAALAPARPVLRRRPGAAHGEAVRDTHAEGRQQACQGPHQHSVAYRPHGATRQACWPAAPPKQKRGSQPYPALAGGRLADGVRHGFHPDFQVLPRRVRLGVSPAAPTCAARAAKPSVTAAGCAAGLAVTEHGRQGVRAQVTQQHLDIG